jgi:uncharacterized protein (DUF342 family)
MFITLEFLKEKSACSAVQKYFSDHFPEGAEYQDVLDVLAKENERNYADWLLKNVGKTDAVMEIDDDLEVEGNIFFAGSIKIKGFLKATLSIKAGSGIEAGAGIKAAYDERSGTFAAFRPT